MTNDVKHELWYLVRLQYTVVQKIHPFTFYFGFNKCQTICIIFGPQWHDLSSSTSSHACRRHIRPHTDAISVDSEVLRCISDLFVYCQSISFSLSFFLEQSSAAYHICSVTSSLLLSLEDILLRTLLPVITVVVPQSDTVIYGHVNCSYLLTTGEMTAYWLTVLLQRAHSSISCVARWQGWW